jgi:hypothetical protein
LTTDPLAIKKNAPADSLIHLMTDEEVYAHAQSLMDILHRADREEES